jgi:hypothetical protein
MEDTMRSGGGREERDRMEALALEAGDVVAGASTSDKALARAARADREAFLTLYDRYVARVERYIAVRIGSDEVEDLISPRPAASVSAKTLLERAAQVAGHVRPYRATAEITVQGEPGDDLPTELQRTTGLSQTDMRSCGSTKTS